MATWMSGETGYMGFHRKWLEKDPCATLRTPRGSCGTDDFMVDPSHNAVMYMFQYGTQSSDVIRHHPKCLDGAFGEFHEMTTKMGC